MGDKISALTELATIPASGDLLPIVDISDTTQAASGTTKKIQYSTVFDNYLSFSEYPSDSAWTTSTSLLNGWTGTIRYIKRAGVVYIELAGLDGSGQTSRDIFSLPAGYEPDVPIVWASCTDVSSAPDKSVAIFVNSSGTIGASSSTDSTGTAINGAKSYPVL